MESHKQYRVVMGDGDGYCMFFRKQQILERVSERWFPNKLGEWGDAILFRIVGGTSDGTYVAFTAGPYGPPDERIFESGYLSVVAHHIKNPTSSFALSDADPCGKTYINLVDKESRC